MSALDEQETTVTQLRNDITRIYTSNPIHLRRLRADARATELSGDEEHGFFTVTSGGFDPLQGFKHTRNYTPEQRAAAGERMRSLINKQTI